MPEPPVVPAFSERMKREPDDVTVPSPVSMLTAPPVLGSLLPACTLTKPPLPLSPEPTVICTEPARPLVAAPDPT